MSHVLAFDTSSERLALGVGARLDGGRLRVLGQEGSHAPRLAMSLLLPRIHELLCRAEVAPASLGAVVVGVGPGSFTGVRIAVATAKGLAVGWDVPLFGVGTLDAIAWGLWLDGERGMLGVVGDAMRGEVYPAQFDLDETGVRRLTAHAVAAPALAAASFAEQAEPLLLAGNGLHKHAVAFDEALGARARYAAVEAWAPTGAGLLAAFAAAEREGVAGDGDPGALLPVYTRLSDAEEAERIRAGFGGAS